MSAVNKKVGVIGRGFVGGSLTTVLAERGVDVFSFDVAKKPLQSLLLSEHCHHYFQYDNYDRVSDFANAVDAVSDSEHSIFFVCVPTPMKKDGSCDTSIVHKVLAELAEDRAKYAKARIAVVKSTVPPGSVKEWNDEFNGSNLWIIHNPEFLREATALEDMRNQSWIALGGPRPYINHIKHFYERVFPNVPIVKTSSTTTEMIKYLINVHLAVKVSLANEFWQICDALDRSGCNVDYDKVVEYATMDSRLGKSHWNVPGPMPSDSDGKQAFGYAGSCFPKDINALMTKAVELGVDPKVMRGSWEKNLEVRPQRDWETLKGRAVSDDKSS